MIDLQPRYDLMEAMLHEGEQTKHNFRIRIEKELGVRITTKALDHYVKVLRNAGIIDTEVSMATHKDFPSTRQAWYRLATICKDQGGAEFIRNPTEITDNRLLAYMGVFTGKRPRGRSCSSEHTSHSLTPIRNGSYGVSHVYQGGL